jgi:hypothetical protein
VAAFLDVSGAYMITCLSMFLCSVMLDKELSVPIYSNFLSMEITPSESYTRHELSALLGIPLVDMHMENVDSESDQGGYITPRKMLDSNRYLEFDQGYAVISRRISWLVSFSSARI